MLLNIYERLDYFKRVGACTKKLRFISVILVISRVLLTTTQNFFVTTKVPGIKFNTKPNAVVWFAVLVTVLTTTHQIKTASETIELSLTAKLATF